MVRVLERHVDPGLDAQPPPAGPADLSRGNPVLARPVEDRVPLLGRPLEARVPCATLLHLSAPELLQGRYATLGRHLLKAEGAILTIFEARRLVTRPLLSFRLQSANRRLYRSPTLAPEQIDNLYSEAVTLAVPSDMA